MLGNIKSQKLKVVCSNHQGVATAQALHNITEMRKQRKITAIEVLPQLLEPLGQFPLPVMFDSYL
jgi:hypothetical protein